MEVKFIRKRKQPQQARKRDREAEDEDEEGGVVKLGAKKSVGLTAKSGTEVDGKEKADWRLASESTTSDAKEKFSFKASGTAASLGVNMATRTIDVDGIEEDRDNRDDGAADAGDDKYKGLANYKEYVNKKVGKVTQSNAGGLRAGPLKGQNTVRITTRFDYQQDICKDYKDSGNCGFGDSCIYMHDRGDYKTGWQLDLEWEAEQKAKKAAEDVNRFLIEEGEGEPENGDDEDDVPTDCMICRSSFKDPVVTKCRHYFCEACALKHYTKSSKCFECNQPTGGVFAVAKDLQAKLAEKKRKMAEREEAIRKKVQEDMGNESEEEVVDED